MFDIVILPHYFVNTDTDDRTLWYNIILFCYPAYFMIEDW